jgi:hypothetical protein
MTRRIEKAPRENDIEQTHASCVCFKVEAGIGTDASRPCKIDGKNSTVQNECCMVEVDQAYTMAVELNTVFLLLPTHSNMAVEQN